MLPYAVATKRLQQRRAFIPYLRAMCKSELGLPYTRIFHMIRVMGEKHKIGAKGILNVTIIHHQVQLLFLFNEKTKLKFKMFVCRFPHWSFQECQEEGRIRKNCSADSCGNRNKVLVTYLPHADLVGRGEKNKKEKVKKAKVRTV